MFCTRRFLDLTDVTEELSSFFGRKNLMEAELVRSKNDTMSLNTQLLEAIQRKLELSQELEAWQVGALTSLWSFPFLMYAHSVHNYNPRWEKTQFEMSLFMLMSFSLGGHCDLCLCSSTLLYADRDSPGIFITKCLGIRKSFITTCLRFTS